MEDASDSVEVVVVGAGPAGLIAGIVLGTYGIDVAVIEKRPHGSTLSRATVISTRCMEILRSWGLEPDVRAGGADVVPRAWVTRSVASGEGVEMPLGYPTAAEAADVSPTFPSWTPQDHLDRCSGRTCRRCRARDCCSVCNSRTRNRTPTASR